MRYGGDEFVVVLPATTLPVAQAVLTRATQAVAELPVDTGAGVTMSVGVVRMPPAGSPDAALADADAAMYRAKRAGGNRVLGGAVPEQRCAVATAAARPSSRSPTRSRGCCPG